jgi:hypothetical protein
MALELALGSWLRYASIARNAQLLKLNESEAGWMTASEAQHKLKLKIRWMLALVIFGLLAGGATAIPLETELKLLAHFVANDATAPGAGLAGWIVKVRDSLIDTNAKYPFIAYGTDWLAFAHFVIAIAFIGPWRDPDRNVWVVEFGMIACVLIVPFALVMGGFRGIPFGWRLIDCSFGVFGIIPLWFCRRYIRELARLQRPGF